MSGNTSLGGIIAQGSKVEKVQEVQHQGPEWRRQKALAAAEEEKLRQHQQVRKTVEGEKNVSVTEREQQHQKESDSEDPARKGKKPGEQRDDRVRKPAGRHIIDIVV